MIIDTIKITPEPHRFFGERRRLKTSVESALVRMLFDRLLPLDRCTPLPKGLCKWLVLLCDDFIKGVGLPQSSE